MQYLSRLYDLAVLNLLFLLSCLPVFTAGAASAALYTVCFRMDTEKETGIFRSYFRAFRENFRQGTLLWLLFLLFGGGCLANILLFSSRLPVLGILFRVLFALAVMIFSYVFPLLSRFSNDVRSTLKNAMALCLGYLPRSVILGALNIFPWTILVLNLYAFLNMAFAWVFLYFSAAAYVGSRLLKSIFAPYLNTEENDP